MRSNEELLSLGWEGSGLGSEQQGIKEPIKGGQVRSKQDKYKGVGINLNDPFEEFRRSKSYTYNRRPPSGQLVGCYWSTAHFISFL